MGDNGVLNISNEGIQKMLNTASQGAQNMATVAAMAQMAAIEQKQTMLKDNSQFEYERALAKGWGYNYTGDNEKERLDALDKKLQEGNFDFGTRTITKKDLGSLSDEEIAQLYNQYHNTYGWAEKNSSREAIETDLS
jgi:hypothetical protein